MNPTSDQLGEVIGYYRNLNPADGMIGVFSKGIAWTKGDSLIELPYLDIASIATPDGKRLPGLYLTTKDGRQFMLPVMGQHGRFLDSFSMMRFLDRTIKDLSGHSKRPNVNYKNPIRSARPDEFDRLNEIEQTADELYATVGLGIVLDMPTAAHERLAAGPLWVAVDETDRPIGFVLGGEIDGFALIDQLSVLPEHGRKGIGGRLIATAVEWARGTGAQAIVLGTYRDVPWNQPFYEKHGFVEMPESEWREEIRATRAQEIRLGHDPARRVFMWRKLR